MTERQGLFQLELRSRSKHFLRCGREPITCVWFDIGWMVPGWPNLRTSDDLNADGWTYLGPAPTYEQAQADAADARRFRWLVDCHSYSMRVLPPYKFAHGINWSVGGQEDDIRAEIDAAMKEDSNA